MPVTSLHSRPSASGTPETMSICHNCMGATVFWRLEPRSDGRPARLGPTLADAYDGKLETIADGTAIAVVPAGDRRFALRPGLVAVPVDGAEPCQVVVATRTDDTGPLVAEFVKSAVTCLVRPT
ncbi:hypothetical protein GCM10010376_58020 [Streptomyces violaceusniger]